MQINTKDKLYEELITYLSITLCTNLLVSKEEYAAGSTSRHRLKNFTCFLQTKSSLTLGFFSFSVSILLWLAKDKNLLRVNDTDVSVLTRRVHWE